MDSHDSSTARSSDVMDSSNSTSANLSPSSVGYDETRQRIFRPGRRRLCDRPVLLNSHGSNAKRQRIGPTMLSSHRVSSRTVVSIDGTPSHTTYNVNASQGSIISGFTNLSRRSQLSSRTVVGVHGGSSQFTSNVDGSQASVQSCYTNVSQVARHGTSRHQNENIQGRRMTYWDCGDASYTCIYCGAMMWYGERTRKAMTPTVPKFSLCCGEGKVVLPKLREPPQLLNDLLYGRDRRSKVFKDNVKVLNSMFAFTSTGGKVNKEINDGRGPYIFSLNGHNHHRIGSLVPTHSDGRPRFAQLYIYDTGCEIENRFHALKHCIPSDSDQSILRSLVHDITSMLDEYNPLVKAFRMAKDRFSAVETSNVKLRLIGSRHKDGRQYNLPTASEVAALIPGDGNPTDSRDVLIEFCGSGVVKRISELHPSFMALQYPLLFPYGEDGFELNIPLSRLSESATRKFISLREYYCFRLQFRHYEGHALHLSGRLFQTFIVDAYSAVLEHTLDWYKKNQKQIRSELYYGLQDRFLAGESSGADAGRRVVLPATFTGGPRYMMQQYQDAMAVCRWAGTPDLFITMTCNPRWPEIDRHVKKYTPQQLSSDRPEIFTRIFKVKLEEFVRELRKNHHFGLPKAVIYTVEFQKRGLPHCHALLFLQAEDKIRNPADIDKIISAEIPSEIDDPDGYAAVCSHMMHGPCGLQNLSSSCMVNGRCTKNFPKDYCEETYIKSDGWPCYKRPMNSRVANTGSHAVKLDNRYVVPYNRNLLVKFGCHLNVEWCNQGMLVKYLFKYINKGPDRTTIVLEGGDMRNPISTMSSNANEIEEYINCRYISSTEACWKLFAFEMHYRDVSVERLPFHEEDAQRIYYRDGDNIGSVLDRPTSGMSKFTQWFKANQDYAEARLLTYTEFPTNFTWDEKALQWNPRQRGFSIGRIYYVNPSAGEKYYLRMLLNVKRGPTSFQDIRTVNGEVYGTYMEACKALGLLGDDTEWVSCIRDAVQWKSGYQTRALFVTILLFCTVSDYGKFFSDCYQSLSEDVVFNRRMLLGDHNVNFTDHEILNYTLVEIQKLLNSNGRSLNNFPGLPQIDTDVDISSMNRLVAAERCYNIQEEDRRYNNMYDKLNVGQKNVFNSIMNSVDGRTGGVFFVMGSGGTGKTYLWKTLISLIRSRGRIVLSVASSGIASMLLPGGRTAHSRFRIPMDVDEDSCCAIDVGSDLADLINRSDLIIWDEAPLQHRHVFEAVDRTFRDICRPCGGGRESRVFGGKVVVLGGDFRQILPVVPKSVRSEIVGSVINKSATIWDQCKVFSLTTNMRLHDPTLTAEQKVQMESFNTWILQMGAGRLPAVALDDEDEPTWIRIPDDLLIPVCDDPVTAVVSHTFPRLIERITDFNYLRERCILCPTNDDVDRINSHVLEMLPGDIHELLSYDDICSTTDNHEEMRITYPVEFLNTLRFSGIPNHVLELKIGVPILLMRNINMDKGLCNGTRLVVTNISQRLIEGLVITGTHVGTKALIPRIDMTPTNTCWPFQLKRRQFPIKVCFAMTINKSQGQTFNNVCTFLEQPIFSHGQLYVAASRVTSRAGLRFYVDNGGKCSNNLTKNVVYREVFYNLPSMTTVHSND